MPQATESITTSRRSFLTVAAGAAAVPAFPLPAVSADTSVEHEDALLLRCGRELVEAWREERKLDALYGYQSTPEIDKEFDDARERTSRLADMIRDTAAFTIEGLRVKAVAILCCSSGDTDLFEANTTDIEIARSIVLDLLTINPFGAV